MDRNSFSIIIPMVGSEQMFENTLASLLRTRPANSQIIVAHAGDYSDPYDLKREVTFVQTEGSTTNVASLLNRAIDAAEGELTAIVKPGIELPEDWSGPVAEAFNDPHVGTASIAIADQHKTNMLVAAGVTTGGGQRRKLVGMKGRLQKRSTARLRPLGPTLWTGFYRSSALKAIAPMCERLDTMYLDLDLALACRSLGYSCHWLPELVATTAQTDAIIEEARTPHGRSAQRAVRRHGLSGTMLHFCLELAIAPLKPSLFRHAFGRLVAGNKRPDTAFRDRLTEQADANATLPFNAPTRRETLRRAA